MNFGNFTFGLVRFEWSAFCFALGSDSGRFILGLVRFSDKKEEHYTRCWGRERRTASHVRYSGWQRRRMRLSEWHLREGRAPLNRTTRITSYRLSPIFAEHYLYIARSPPSPSLTYFPFLLPPLPGQWEGSAWRRRVFHFLGKGQTDPFLYFKSFIVEVLTVARKG